MIFLQILEGRHNRLFSSLTHLYFSVVKGPKTEDPILTILSFSIFNLQKLKIKIQINDEQEEMNTGKGFQAVKPHI